MTVQSPPYALQNSAHTAALFRQASTSLIATTGVGGPAELQVNATSGMTVAVAAGRAWIPGTSVTGVAGQKFSLQGNYFALNDSQVNLSVATSDPVNPRIDAVYIAVTDSFYSGTDGVVLGVVTGTPAPGPLQPAIPTNALLLAYVAVAANTTNIVAANIADKRGVFGVVGESAVATVNLTPASNTDTSMATAGPSYWLRMGTIFVPPWATTATCLMLINGYEALANNTSCYVQTRLGGIFTPVRQLASQFATAGARLTHATSDAINVSSLAGTAGTLQTIDIMSQYIAGSASIRADIYSTATIQVTFT